MFQTLTYRKPRYYRTQFMLDITWLVCKLNKIGNFRLVPELTNVGDLHFHIMIEIKDLLGFKILNAMWKTKNGFINISNVKSEFNTFMYMMKEKLLMKMGFKYHMITNSTIKILMEWIKDTKRSAERKNDIIPVIEMLNRAKPPESDSYFQGFAMSIDL